MTYLLSSSSSMAGLPAYYGVMVTPARWGLRPVKEARRWAGDNGAFTRGFDPEAFTAFLERMAAYRGSCLFVAAPDVVADAGATLALYPAWAKLIRSQGYPVAFVAQDGQEHLELPDCDALFIGGSTEWKLSSHAKRLIAEVKARGLHAHMGRVNSLRRISLAWLWGCDSADGTHEAFKGRAQTVALFNRALRQPTLGVS